MSGGAHCCPCASVDQDTEARSGELSPLPCAHSLQPRVHSIPQASQAPPARSHPSPQPAIIKACPRPRAFHTPSPLHCSAWVLVAPLPKAPLTGQLMALDITCTCPCALQTQSSPRHRVRLVRGSVSSMPPGARPAEGALQPRNPVAPGPSFYNTLTRTHARAHAHAHAWSTASPRNLPAHTWPGPGSKHSLPRQTHFAKPI